MTPAEVSRQTKDKMEKALEHLRTVYKSIRSGRASSAMIEHVKVDYYGTPTPLAQMSTVVAADPRTLTIKPFDASALKEIEKAIIAADLGLNPQSDGKVIRITVPPLSEERRKQIVAQAKDQAEQCKVNIRYVRRDMLKIVEDAHKAKTMTEDDSKKLKDGIQELVKQYEKTVDDTHKKKAQEIMEV